MPLSRGIHSVSDSAMCECHQGNQHFMVQGVEFAGFRVYGAGLGGQPASYELRMHPDSARSKDSELFKTSGCNCRCL